MPQLPTTTVVTPWLTFIAMSGVFRRARSSWVWTSMKPGATTLPAASITVWPGSGATAAEGDDAVAAEADVGCEGGAAGAVDHLGVADDDLDVHGAHLRRQLSILQNNPMH